MAQVRLMLANVYLKLRHYDSLMDQLDSYLKENPKGAAPGLLKKCASRFSSRSRSSSNCSSHSILSAWDRKKSTVDVRCTCCDAVLTGR